MARVKIREVVLGADGRPGIGAIVLVCEPGTSTPTAPGTPIAATLRSARTGGTTLTNPLTANAAGEVVVWIDAYQLIDLYETYLGATRNVPLLSPEADLADYARTASPTLSSPTINNPTMTGGTWASPTLTSPTLSGAILTTPTVTTPAITDGSLAGVVTADLVLTPPTNNSLFKMRTTGSSPTNTGTWDLPRDALAWLRDLNESATAGCVIKVDMREDTGTGASSIARTGIHTTAYTKLDRGESSALLAVQSGGGGCIACYSSFWLRPDGKPLLGYTPQVAGEFGTDNQSTAALFQAGVFFPASPGNPLPTLTAGITASTTTIPISSTALIPTPGAAVPTNYDVPGFTNWSTPLYLIIDAFTASQEVISYTGGGAGSAVSGVVRGLGGAGVVGTGTTHSSGATVRFLCAQHAVQIRLGHPLAKGQLVIPGDGVFDARPAYAVGINVPGKPVDTSYTFRVNVNGDMPTVRDITSSGQVSAANLQTGGNLNVVGAAAITGALSAASLTSRRLIGSGTPTIAAGAGAGTGPTVSVSGTDLSGQITVATGTTPTANAVVATVTFSATLGAAPKAVLLTPANGNARALSGTGQVWIDIPDISATAFAVRANVALAASTNAYQWYYLALG